MSVSTDKPEALLYWVKEREAIRKKKESGAEAPWTADPILARYRFCNVRRRDDRVSQWLRRHVLTGDNVRIGFGSFLMFSAFCRWNNWPPVIKEILDRGLYPKREISWTQVIAVVEEFQARKEKSYTGAYMINAKGVAPGQSKAEFIVNQVICVGVGAILPELNAALTAGLRRGVWGLLQTRMNWGSFMAGQVVDDWSWTLLLDKAKDANTWAPQGPGSIRGFNRLRGLPLKTRHGEEEWCGQLQAWREAIISELGREYRDVTLMDTQNCLCELDKYLRAKNGEGRPRSTYKPETAYGV